MGTRVKVVIGANAGDEGKGNITSRFAAGHDTIGVLTNGGPQRGHTVVYGGRRHVFSHFSSGTFTGASTYFGPDFMVNPMQFVREYEELSEAGVTMPPVYIDPRCRFTTPFDMMLNQAAHEAAGTHHTCGMGIWETYVRYRDAGKNGPAVPVGVFLEMTYNQKLLYLLKIREQAVIRMRESYPKDFCTKWKVIMESPYLPEHFIADTLFMCETAGRICRNEILLTAGHIVMENGQGLLLDWSDDEILAKYSTPSRTGAEAALGLIEDTFVNAEVEMCYVTRTYLTRHGDGPLHGECHPDAITPRICERTNVTNPFQGSFRYGKMDVESLSGRINRDYERIFEIGRDKSSGGGLKEIRGSGERSICRLHNRYTKSLAITHADEILPSEELTEASRSFDRHYIIASA
ncbi:MAG TPA: hypothetical protein DCG37_07205 [Lachnospiraceae bacterium]|nr:hypothetical protein [Lachnospiraceae bacterium]